MALEWIKFFFFFFCFFLLLTGKKVFHSRFDEDIRCRCNRLVRFRGTSDKTCRWGVAGCLSGRWSWQKIFPWLWNGDSTHRWCCTLSRPWSPRNSNRWSHTLDRRQRWGMPWRVIEIRRRPSWQSSRRRQVDRWTKETKVERRRRSADSRTIAWCKHFLPLFG